MSHDQKLDPGFSKFGWSLGPTAAVEGSVKNGKLFFTEPLNLTQDRERLSQSGLGVRC